WRGASRSKGRGGPDGGTIVAVVPPRVRGHERHHGTANGRRDVVLRVGTPHPFRAAHDPALHVHRLVFRGRPFPVQGQKGTQDFGPADQLRHCRRGNLFPAPPPPFCLPPPQTLRVARCGLRTLPHSRPAAQPVPVIAHHVADHPGRHLRETHPRTGAPGGVGLVQSHRLIYRADLPAPRGGCGGRGRPGGLVFLP